MWKNNALDNLHSGLLDQNIVLISGDVDGDMAMYIREAFLRLTVKGSPPITLLITSPGGSVDIGLDICDALRSYAGEITGIVHGYANSMAAIILQVCKKRAAMRHSHILVHHISRRQISLDTLRDQKKTKEAREDLEKSQRMIYNILVNRTGRTIDEIKKICAKDQAMDAEEALNFGLIDEIR